MMNSMQIWMRGMVGWFVSWIMFSYYIRWRTNFSSRLSLMRSSGFFCRNCLCQKRCAIANPIAVPELPIVPFFQRSTKSKL